MRPPLLYAAVLLTGLAFQAGSTPKPRVFITESRTSQAVGEANVGAAQGSLAFSGGNTPENVEVIKTVSRRCPGVIVTADRARADYILRLDHEAINPTTPFVHGNKIALFNKQQDLLYSNSTHTLGSAVKAACSAITADHQPVPMKSITPK